jgi:hypothetical protein
MPPFKSLSDVLYQSVTKRGKSTRQQQQKSPREQQPERRPILAISQQYARVLLQLPEILDPVFSLLDLKSLLAARLVCKQWASIARCCLALRLLFLAIAYDIPPTPTRFMSPARPGFFFGKDTAPHYSRGQGPHRAGHPRAILHPR